MKNDTCFVCKKQIIDFCPGCSDIADVGLPCKLCDNYCWSRSDACATWRKEVFKTTLTTESDRIAEAVAEERERWLSALAPMASMGIGARALVASVLKITWQEAEDMLIARARLLLDATDAAISAKKR